ncbi:MAG TPA: bifunctional [glutamate--ammonia ligase]-adenylyl-L-tyrosine phosphorylase/[glutamate--ammonia-ligase] adenylyltransferase [Planctomycetota bacterium]
MSGRLRKIAEAVAQKPALALTDAEWLDFGFRSVPAARAGFAALQSKPAVGTALSGKFEPILCALAQSCDADQAFFKFQRWIDAGGPEQSAGWEQPAFLSLLCQLFAATPALSEYLIRFPGRTAPILQPVLNKQVTGGTTAWRELLKTALGKCDSYSTQLAAVRRMRVECTLQIAALDLSLRVALQDTVRALSDLADACIDAALTIAIERLRPRMGIPAEPTPPSPFPLREGGGGGVPFVVFALGKLGGRELNYSSDIDLVFAYQGEGETVETTRPTDLHTYFMALAEELVNALDKITDDGRVYRVDLRLRPHGSVGMLAQSIAQMLNYFQAEGRTWERQAWLKARAVAGDLALGNTLLTGLTTFIFRRYLTLDAIGDMQALKRQIELSVSRRGETDDEVKLGRGGIRDIEFTVQFMQLLHGSEYARVRRGNTLRTLEDLRHEKLLGDLDAEALTDAYIFLRNAEHRLQLHGDLQVHKLPSDPLARRRIALSLGYVDTPASGTLSALSAQDAFENDRQRHTARTREVFESLFANLFRENQGPEGELSDLLLAPEPDLNEIGGLMHHFGLDGAEGTARELVAMSRENVPLTAPSRTRKFFASVAPRLLRELTATGEPDEALRRFSRIVGSLGAKAVFYQMLNENNWLLRMTVELAAWSEYLTDILVANPGLFDELVDALQTGHSKSAADMLAELGEITKGGDISDTLRAYRAGELLRIGVRDLIHDAQMEQTQGELSDLAEAILRIQLQHSLKHHREQYGDLKTAAGKPAGFAIIALGKFGGREMNYGSDLDVIFFYGSEGQTDSGIAAVTYFGELAQLLTRALATPTGLGSLYQLDARLRPSGGKGPLAQSAEYFKQYWQSGQLADWERLALTRARFVAGDEAVAERALHLIRSAIYSPLKDTRTLGGEVRDMRKRLEASADPDDMKRGRGGIMDIEFTAQYLQLVHAPALPPLRQANTEQSLRMLMKFGKLTREDGTALLEAYAFLRRMENRVRIVHGLSAHKLPQKSDALRRLALRAGYSDQESSNAEEQVKRDYESWTGRVRGIFEKVVV